MRRLTALFALALVLVTLPASLAAAAPRPKVNFYDFQNQVMCVVCRVALASASGPQADSERQTIRNLIAQGRSESQIKDALVAAYGDRVLALPKDNGINVAVYIVPIAVVLIGLAGLAFALPRWRRHAAERAARPFAIGSVDLSADDARRLDDDLARYDP
jgi:cytochrome c-type biogenesis protein CcmH/NrfF